MLFKKIKKEIYFFELVTFEPVRNYYNYYYFYITSKNIPCSPKMSNAYPEELRLLIAERDEMPFQLTQLSLLKYALKTNFSFKNKINCKKHLTKVKKYDII